MSAAKHSQTKGIVVPYDVVLLELHTSLSQLRVPLTADTHTCVQLERSTSDDRNMHCELKIR